MSVPSQWSAEGRSRRCARSIPIGFCRAMRGASSAARPMITTIAIPMRARLSRRNLCRCLGSSIALPRRYSSRWISQLARRVRRLSLPSAVLPEILRRHRSYPFLEMLRETCNDRVDVAIPVACNWRLDSLDHDPVATIRLAQRDDEYDGHLESQGEYRRTAGSLRRPAEERHEGGRQTQNPLVGDERDGPSTAQRPRCSAHRLRIVNDRHPHCFTGVIEESIEERIGHSPHDCVEWNTARGNVGAGELPVADVAGHQYGALPFR